MHSKRAYAAIVVVLVGVFAALWALKPANAPVGTAGVKEVVKGLPGVGTVAFDGAGRMFASIPEKGQVVRLETSAGKEEFKNLKTVLSGLKNPYGIAFYKDSKSGSEYLYVAETHQVVRYAYSSRSGETGGQPKNIMNFPTLPAGTIHEYRSIIFGPNIRSGSIISGSGPLSDPPGASSPIKLYATVPSSCEACIESSWKFAAVLESDPDGTYAAEVASGFANTLFIAQRPGTKEIWATDTARTGGPSGVVGEINMIQIGKNYGWPFCYGDKVKDTTFSPGKVERTDIPTDCSKTLAPAAFVARSSAPAGLAFVPSSSVWSGEMKGSLFVALAGDKKIARYIVENPTVIRQKDIVSVWPGSKPSFMIFDADGDLFVVDSERGSVYKISPEQQ